MKALEILKKERQIVSHLDGISFDEAIAELEALQSQIKIKDTAINSQRLTIGLLEDERANMQRTHQLTIKSYRKQIEALQAPKTCDGCSHEKQSSPLYIHCFGCNRMKTLIDKYHDKNTPCRE